MVKENFQFIILPEGNNHVIYMWQTTRVCGACLNVTHDMWHSSFDSGRIELPLDGDVDNIRDFSKRKQSYKNVACTWSGKQ